MISKLLSWSALIDAVAALAQRASPASYPFSDLSTPGNTDRLLVVAPHPDDETLCCAGTMRRAIAAGAQVQVVWLTSGDAFEIDAEIVEHRLRPTPQRLQNLGTMRMREAAQAASILGVPAGGTIFLGYPDRGLLPLMLDHYYSPYTSPHTRASRVWYEGALSPGAAYEGRNLQRDLQSVIQRLRPTRVLAPSPLDQHPDHRAAGDLVIRILGELNELDTIRYWIVHGGLGWPAPRGLHPDVALAPPRSHREMRWETVPLTREERDLKLRALRAYYTQLQATPRFLFAFVRSNELFARRPLPPDVPAPSAHP